MKNKEVRDKVFLLTFDSKISSEDSVTKLQNEVASILMIACDTDEVIIKIKSPGGSVMTYGLAASILESIKQKDISRLF